MDRYKAVDMFPDRHLIYEEYENIFNDTINKIYDDFESRTCENCKHMEDGGLGLFHYCNKMQHEVYGEYSDDSHMENIYVYKDFGCNKFKRKQERKQDGNV